MKRFIIERDIPGIGTAGPGDLQAAAKTSNAALSALGSGIQWIQSYIVAEKTYCVYLAESEDIIRRHAEISGFPASRIQEVAGLIDPTTEHGNR